MSLKSSARIKKRRSEAAAANYAAAAPNPNPHPHPNPSPSPAPAPVQASSSSVNTSSSSSITVSAAASSNSNPNAACQSASKKHTFVGRNPNFDTDETKLLIQLWGDPKLQRTLITTHKKHAVICQLAAKMQEYGYHRSPEEITTRIKNLKCFYNRLKKDKECGALSTDAEPSWKHFAEMDAIMTRPIFSVRPNEVPAPSLKYQLEQALEEHAERRKRRLENGEELSESDNEEDDMLLSALVSKKKDSSPRKDLEAGCLESDQDVNEESFVKRRKISTEVDVDIGEALIKAEPVPEVEAAPPPAAAAAPVAVDPEPEEDDDCLLLPLPKEEPIDVDASDDSPNEKSSSPSTSSTLAQMLQRNKATGSLLPFTGANVIIPASITTTSASSSSATVQSSSTAVGKLQAGKISLVPTNFLMQSKLPAATATGPGPIPTSKGAAPQLQLLQSAINQGARLMISGSPAAPPQQPVMATAPGGVKFVLVNAEQAKAAAAAASVGKSSATLPLSTAQAQAQAAHAAVQQHQHQQKLQQSLHQEQMQQQQMQHQQHIQLEKEESRRAQEKAREDQQSKRHMTTMRILLRQLLNAQNESNEIQHNRLSLERERLDWEKSMGERVINLLPSLLQPAAATATPSSTAQRLQPPKLLFTTALPMANGTVSMPHILTSNSLPKVIATTSISAGAGANVAPKPVDNDVQLVTPKQEKEG
ncbi:hypothetical protein KR009_002308 [Drosophila setifemur]|nr:hypothetical protein KR009_002308 [Drosophila setifemur]